MLELSEDTHSDIWTHQREGAGTTAQLKRQQADRKTKTQLRT
jgi:hypothetical protein